MTDHTSPRFKLIRLLYTYIHYFLVEEKNRMIENGEIDMGRLICPVSRLLQKGGCAIEQVVFGRCIDLQKIRKLHLESMATKKLLRQTNLLQINASQCKHILNKHNGM